MVINCCYKQEAIEYSYAEKNRSMNSIQQFSDNFACQHSVQKLNSSKTHNNNINSQSLSSIHHVLFQI